MFDYNVAPFFQSFIEVKVEPSAHRVRLIPHGVNGRLTLGDVATSASLRAGRRHGSDAARVDRADALTAAETPGLSPDDQGLSPVTAARRRTP